MSSSAHPEPEQLLRLAQAGNGPALGQLLELYRHYLALLARFHLGRRLQAKVDASDLVQEAFLEAHRDFAQFRGATERELVSWLRHILASNLANLTQRYWGSQCRDVRLERQLAVELDQSSQVLDRGLLARQSSPSEHAARREQAVLLADALAQLPADYQEVILLRHVERHKFEEIAVRMGRSAGAVRMLWTRALERLQRVLEVAS